MMTILARKGEIMRQLFGILREGGVNNSSPYSGILIAPWSVVEKTLIFFSNKLAAEGSV